MKNDSICQKQKKKRNKPPKNIDQPRLQILPYSNHFLFDRYI